MQTNIRKHNIIIAVMSLLIVVFLFAWYILYMRMEQVGASISASMQAQMAAEVHAEQMKNMTVSLDTVSADAAMINAYIVPPDGEVTFIERVEALAKALGLSIKVNTVGLSQASDLSAAGLEYLNLKLSVTGPWQAVFDFLSMTENLPYDVTVSQSDIASVSDGTVKGPRQWQGDFQIGVIKQHSPTEQN
jgi:hypothetical protein